MDDDPRTVNTEFGPLDIDVTVLRLWNRYGWPADRVLAQMVADQKQARRQEMGS